MCKMLRPNPQKKMYKYNKVSNLFLCWISMTPSMRDPPKIWKSCNYKTVPRREPR